MGATEHSPPYTIAGFSSRGPAGPNCGPEENRIKPEVSAPGVNIYSSVPGGGYGYLDGTSMAAPHVAGVVALMRSANPDVDVITIKQVLMATATDLGDAGEDNDYGHGFIDAYAAVQPVMGGFGNVEGTVTDADTGDPVAGAPGLRASALTGSTTTDADRLLRLPICRRDHGTIEVIGLRLRDPEPARDGDRERDHQRGPGAGRLPTVTVSGDWSICPGQSRRRRYAGGRRHHRHRERPRTRGHGRRHRSVRVGLPIGSDYQLPVTSGSAGYLTQTVPFYDDLDLDLYLTRGTPRASRPAICRPSAGLTGGPRGWTVQGDEVHSGN